MADDAENTPVYDTAASATPGAGLNFSWPDLSGIGGPAVYAAGAGLEIFSTIAQTILAGKRTKAVSRYNMQVAEANAQAAANAAEIEAQQLARRAAILRQDQFLVQQAQTWRETRQREQGERVIGQTRAIIGASGLLMEGSPLAVMEETVRQQALDTLAGRYQATLQQRALEEEATQAEYGAALARFGGQERLRVGKQQSALIQAQTPSGYGAAALARGIGAASKGISTYGYMKERQRAGQTLLG